MSDATYRARNLDRANILVDVEVPEHIHARIDTILASLSMSKEGKIHSIAETWYSESRQLVVAQTAGEAEWIEVMQRCLKDLMPDELWYARNRGVYSA